RYSSFVITQRLRSGLPTMNASAYRSFRASLRPLLWPLAALAALLLFNLLFTEGFARLTIRGGHVYGSLVDILKLSSRVTMVAVIYLIAVALTRGTAMGLFIESVGNNETASLFAGVGARAVKIFVYTFAGFCAGIAGLVEAADIKEADASNAGLYVELDSI